MKRNKYLLLFVLLISLSVSIIKIIIVLNSECIEFKLNNYRKYEINKVIIIGDSRMELIELDRVNLEIPNNITFIAKSGARINWFYDKGLPLLMEELKNNNKKYNYKIIFNLGVNDLNSNKEVLDISKEYISVYKDIIFRHQDLDFYFLSVNPIIESDIIKYFPNQKRTNQKIEEFNDYFIKYTNTFDNFKYLDSYNELNINFYDGLHLTNESNKLIIDFILSEINN